MIINSFLDTDLYKFTMGQLIFFEKSLQHNVTYRFTNRDNSIKLGRIINIRELEKQIKHLFNLRPTEDELNFLSTLTTKSFYNPKEFSIFKKEYLNFLWERPTGVNFQMGVDDDGDLILDFMGKWHQAVFYEVPIMAIISELYTNAIRSKLSTNGKIACSSEDIKLMENMVGIVRKHRSLRFGDFGTRRRHSFEHHREMIYRFKDYHSLGYQFSGTSNILFAKEFGLNAIGTMGHELFMGSAALFGVEAAYPTIDEMWKRMYGDSLSILLPDTFTSDWLFKNHPELVLSYEGVRHDSGDPIRFGNEYISMCEQHGVDPMTKVIVFSDGLDIVKAIEILEYFKGRVWVSFGIGTKFSNETTIVPLKIVIKLFEIAGKPTIKLSDVEGKHTGDKETVKTYLDKISGR